MASTTPVTDRIVSDVNYARGVELVKDCGEGLTLGDAGEARRRARARIFSRGQRAYWLGIARELRTRRVVSAPVSFPAGSRIVTAQGRNEVVVGCEGCGGYVLAGDKLCSNCVLDAKVCRSCGKRADWHDAADMACPDDDAPHPHSVAADDMSGADCDHGPRSVKTCGGCGNSWCDDCDGSPAALCHYCHGRGYSTAPRVSAVLR